MNVWLKLGRVSNLPTVWTNVAAGLVLADAPLSTTTARVTALSLGVALSLFYVGGMFLNDAFDADIDARMRAERPIPRGEVSRRAVFAAGGATLALGVVVIALCAAASGAGLAPLGAAAALTALIVLYDAWHKQNPASPALMAGCRALTLVTAGLAAGGAQTSSSTTSLGVGAAIAFIYIAGVTTLARQEAGASSAGMRASLAALVLAIAGAAGLALMRPSPVALALSAVLLVVVGALVLGVVRAARAGGSVGPFIGRAIACMALVDAVLIASHGAPWLAMAAALGMPLTVRAQRRVRGT